VHDRFVQRPGCVGLVDDALERPLGARLANMIGWITRCTSPPMWLTPKVMESTRNGMSSLITSTTVWPTAQPSVFWRGLNTRTFDSPWARWAISFHSECAAPARFSAVMPRRSPGGTFL